MIRHGRFGQELRSNAVDDLCLGEFRGDHQIVDIEHDFGPLITLGRDKFRKCFCPCSAPDNDHIVEIALRRNQLRRVDPVTFASIGLDRLDKTFDAIDMTAGVRFAGNEQNGETLGLSGGSFPDKGRQLIGGARQKAAPLGFSK